MSTAHNTHQIMDDNELYRMLGEISSTLNRLVQDLEQNNKQFDRLRDRVDVLENWKIWIMGGFAGISLCCGAIVWSITSHIDYRLEDLENQKQTIQAICRELRKTNASICYRGASYE